MTLPLKPTAGVSGSRRSGERYAIPRLLAGQAVWANLGTEGSSTEVLRSAPFIYLTWLTADSHFGRRLEIVPDIQSGLYIEPGFGDRGSAVVVPDASLESLPTGLVERLELHLESETGYCVEVLLTISGRPLLIVAGDVVEGRVGWLDEELLVFEDPSDAERVLWGNPREFDVLEID